MQIISDKEFDKLSVEEKRTYLKNLVSQLPDNQAKKLYKKLKKKGF